MESPTEARFCSHCGASLAAEAMGRAPISAYTPRHLAEKIFSSHAAIEGERKLVTVLFCDIANSTALADRIGAEAMHALLNRFFEAALAEVHACEGTVNQFLGDGFMALFGAPLAHEDHAQRAASAAIGIQRACHAPVADTPMGKAPIRIGLNTGLVVVGAIGDNLRMDYTAIGDTVNLAARMEQIASTGEVLLTRSTWESVHQHFDCEALGGRRVKGKSYPVPVYRLWGRRTSRSPDELAKESTPTSPLVGRENDLAMVRDRVARLRSGEGGIVAVIAEAGLGKSRLMSEARHSENAGVRWLQGAAISFGRHLSYEPFSEALRAEVGIDEGEGRDAGWRRLEVFMGKHLGDQAPKLLPFAGMLLGMELPSINMGLIARLDPQDVRGQIFIVARRLFVALSHAQPTVLELEDWHWSEEASQALLLHLLPLTETEPLLVCFTARPDHEGPCARLREAATTRYGQRYIEIELAPLSDTDSSQLVDKLLDLEHLAPALRGEILRRAEGNPLFIEEVLHALHGTNMLSTAGKADAVALPSSIEAIITARIDRLESEAKQVLRLAAVIGRSFYLRVLQMLDEARNELDKQLDQLQKSDFIKQGKVNPELEYLFKHALVHEASYRSILEERRRQLHHRVGDAIETLFADRLNEVAGLLAYHYAQAGNQGKAQRYLLRAGDQAARMSCDIEALAHYHEAMQSYARAFGDSWERTEHASLERKIGEALYRLGQHQEACQHLYIALELLDYRYPKTRFGVRAHIIWNLLAQVWHQIRPRKSRQHRADIKANVNDRMLATASLAWIDFLRDHERFFLDVLSGLNWADRTDFAEGIVQGQTGLGITLNVLQLHTLAGYCHQRALLIANTIADPLSQAFAMFGLAIHHEVTGELDRAIEANTRAYTIFESQGKLRERGAAVGSLTELLLVQGEFRRARGLISELRRTADDAGDALIALYFSERHAVVQMHDGPLAQAATEFARTAQGLRNVPDYEMCCWTLGKLALCLLWMGDVEHAAGVVQEGRLLIHERSISAVNKFPLVVGSAQLAVTMLECASKREKPAAERSARRAIRELYRLRRAYAMSVPIALYIEGYVDWWGEHHEKAKNSWKRSIEITTRIGARYLYAVTLQEMGRLMRVPSDLQNALALFDQFECRFQTARTLRLLGEVLEQESPAAALDYFQRALTIHESMSAEYERKLTEQRHRELAQRLA